MTCFALTFRHEKDHYRNENSCMKVHSAKLHGKICFHYNKKIIETELYDGWRLSSWRCLIMRTTVSLVLDDLLLVESSLSPAQILAHADIHPFGSTDPVGKENTFSTIFLFPWNVQSYVFTCSLHSLFCAQSKTGHISDINKYQTYTNAFSRQLLSVLMMEMICGCGTLPVKNRTQHDTGFTAWAGKTKQNVDHLALPTVIHWAQHTTAQHVCSVFSWCSGLKTTLTPHTE